MTEQLTQITVVEKDILELKPGEMTCDTTRRHWFIGCPECLEPGGLEKHTITEENGLITVSPSILCKCGAHYFVKQNKIRWA